MSPRLPALLPDESALLAAVEAERDQRWTSGSGPVVMSTRRGGAVYEGRGGTVWEAGRALDGLLASRAP